ncbi:MAG: hypothetical protein ABI672_12265 [Vicinamibacteria bacterium]
MSAAARIAAAFGFLLTATVVCAQEAASLPNGNTYVRNVLRSGPRSQDAAINDYSYDIEEVQENLNKQGVATSRDTLRYEVYFVERRPVRRLISRNGAPLSSTEQADVDRKAAALAKAISEGRTVSEQAGLRLASLVESFDFETLLREDRAGRKTLVFEFKPKPGAAAKSGTNSITDAVAAILTGQVHIDEQDRRVVLLEAHSLEGRKVGVRTGVKLGKFELSMEYTSVADGVWLPKKIVSVAAGRAFLFKTFRIRKTTTYSNYRRFSINTEERPAS